MLAQHEQPAVSRGSGVRDAAATGRVEVPARLRWRGLEKLAQHKVAAGASLGDATLLSFEILSGVSRHAAADAAAAAIVERVDSQARQGVYPLSRADLAKPNEAPAAPGSIAPAPEGKPLLVFVHGTFSTTHGTFRKLWLEHPHLVSKLFDGYEGRVFGFDHKTLGDSPIRNALRLVESLPPGATLHLITHSRGGLVAEVLARVCHKRGVSQNDLAAFAGEDYRNDLEDLQTLGRLVREREVRVERIVRVACPARGTLLASERLDAYVSVLKWALELAGIPVAPQIVEFLGEVAQRRTDPALIPGLAAQVPASALVKWLHAADEPIAGDLRVISGDIESDSIASWLKTLTADAFFWTDNDLVVQTRSMYGGSPRAAGATFLYDRGGKVTHFNYFSNKLTAEAIVNALTSAQPAGFRTIGPLSWKGESATGTRGAPSRGSVGSKPALFLLPGILGSNLKVDGERIWVSWRLVNRLDRLGYAPGQSNVVPDGPIEAVYDRLTEHLRGAHDVVPFAYDWRRPIEEEARRLGEAITLALDERAGTAMPVRILAHSMGGIVARTMQLECPEVWERMMARDGARILMLGVPNSGSWAPMELLSGDDTFGNLIVSTGALLQDHAARQLIARMPGFIQLQAALRDPALRLDTAATWQQLADDDLARVRDYNFWHSNENQLNPYTWGVPPQGVLDQAAALRERLDRQQTETLPRFAAKMALVVGSAPFTPDGYETGEQGLSYTASAGDGRVTLANALLPGVPTWQLDCVHGSLPSQERAFGAYAELLETGTTDRLPGVAGAAVRGSIAAEMTGGSKRPARVRGGDTPPESPAEIVDPPQQSEVSRGEGRGGSLRVTFSNGDLMFERLPLMLGHYTSTRLSGTELVMDRLIGERMSEALAMGQYPDAPRSHGVFANVKGDPENPWRAPRPQAVIVVGLGPEGKLRSSELQATVVNGVIAWAQRLVERGERIPRFFALAATLIGSGGIRVSVGESAYAIVRGVREANERLEACGWPRVDHLHLIDLYLDRASEAWRALQAASNADPGLCNLDDTIPQRAGALDRPLESGYRGADYDFISAVEGLDERKQPAIVYTLNTRRARSEVRAQAAQSALLRELLKNASSAGNDDPQLGRTLFALLVPLELRPFLAGTADMQIEVDRSTAAIPWELLDADDGVGGTGARPWSIRAKLLRRLRTQEFRGQSVDATADAGILIIGEPACNAARYPALPGARAEAEAIWKRFRDGAEGVYVRPLTSTGPGKPGPDAPSIMNALFERPWRIVHISGHGELPLGDNPRGIVLSGGTFLGPNELRNLPVVPELVFVNCCHLGARDSRELFNPSGGERAQFAAGVAEELIKIGVRCVIAAAWAVADDVANVFATVFYGALLQGARFIDAVARAREAALVRGGNTWAAYQCYGDPEWESARACPTDSDPGIRRWILGEGCLPVGAGAGAADARDPEHVSAAVTRCPAGAAALPGGALQRKVGHGRQRRRSVRRGVVGSRRPGRGGRLVSDRARSTGRRGLGPGRRAACEHSDTQRRQARERPRRRSDRRRPRSGSTADIRKHRAPGKTFSGEPIDGARKHARFGSKATRDAGSASGANEGAFRRARAHVASLYGSGKDRP